MSKFKEINPTQNSFLCQLVYTIFPKHPDGILAHWTISVLFWSAAFAAGKEFEPSLATGRTATESLRSHRAKWNTRKSRAMLPNVPSTTQPKRKTCAMRKELLNYCTLIFNKGCNEPLLLLIPSQAQELNGKNKACLAADCFSLHGQLVNIML